jgi:hypothetical protein
MIDTFNRIRLLHIAGVEIHLHCFSYGREQSPVLESLCKTVTYYSRKHGVIHQLKLLPYIVSTRMSPELVENLNKNDYPILFDGLHTTGIIGHSSLTSRKKIVRMHNIEHNYYAALAGNEIRLDKKLYYLAESAKLIKYEKVLAGADHVFSVSPSDNDYFNKRYHNSILMPSSHPFDNVSIQAGSGDYVIYHGDLSVGENSTIAVFLATEVFPNLDSLCIIAGKNPPESLKRITGKFKNIQLVSNPTNREMGKLISEAHINILPVSRMNGLKLKLLYALYTGKHLVINSEMSKGLEQGTHYHIADSSSEMISLISRLMNQPFTEEMINEREKFLCSNFNNQENIKKLTAVI